MVCIIKWVLVWYFIGHFQFPQSKIKICGINRHTWRKAWKSMIMKNNQNYLFPTLHCESWNWTIWHCSINWQRNANVLENVSLTFDNKHISSFKIYWFDYISFLFFKQVLLPALFLFVRKKKLVKHKPREKLPAKLRFFFSLNL